MKKNIQRKTCHFLFPFFLLLFLTSQAVATNLADPNTYIDPGKVARLLNKPNTPEESLVHDFVDWCIEGIEKLGPNGKVRVKTNNDYKIFKTDNGYEVTLSPFNIQLSPSDVLDLGLVVFRCRPLSNRELDFQILLPERFSLRGKKDVKAIFTTAKREISGRWDKDLKALKGYKTLIEDLVITDPKDTASARIAAFTLNGHLSLKDEGRWEQGIEGHMQRASLDIHDGVKRIRLEIKAIDLEGDTAASNYTAYTEARRRLGSVIFSSKDITAKEAKEFVHGLDTFLQNFGHENTKVTLKGLRLESSDDNVTLNGDSLTITSNYKRKTGQRTRLSGDIEALATNLGFSKIDKRSKRPVSLKIERITLNNKFDTKEIPADLFKDIRLDPNIPSTGSMTDREKVDWYLSQAMTKWSELLEKGSMNLNFKNVQAVTSKLPPFSCGSIWAGYGMDFRASRDNVVRINAGYSDLDSPAFKKRIRSSSLFFRLANLPAIKELLPLSGKHRNLGKEVLKRLQHTIRNRTMELSVMASLMGVPQSLATLDMDIKSDPQAKFMSTGSINITLEEPDNFMKIIEAIYPKPGPLQVFASITAIGQRVEKDGKVIDQLNLTIDKDGKVFLNKKDITGLLLIGNWMK